MSCDQGCGRPISGLEKSCKLCRETFPVCLYPDCSTRVKPPYKTCFTCNKKPKAECPMCLATGRNPPNQMPSYRTTCYDCQCAAKGYTKTCACGKLIDDKYDACWNCKNPKNETNTLASMPKPDLPPVVQENLKRDRDVQEGCYDNVVKRLKRLENIVEKMQLVSEHVKLVESPPDSPDDFTAPQ